MAIKLRSALLSSAASLLVAGSAFAHHGWSWAEGEQTKLQGTIQEISFAPPHPSLVVKTDSGAWNIDLANPTQTQRSGFVPGSAKVGDSISILGNRAQDKNQKLMKAVRITVAGKTYDLYPERIKDN